MASKTSKHWRDPTDPWKIKLFEPLTYRTKRGIPIIRAYHGEIPTALIPVHIQAGQNVTQHKYKKKGTQNRHAMSETVQCIPANERKDGWAHFYLDDYQIERFWNFPIRYTKYLQTFQGTLSPDFSVYADYYPLIQEINLYRNCGLGAYWQFCGIPVIPSVSWSTLESLTWCFSAIEPGGIVAVSTMGMLNHEEFKRVFILGYSEMLQRLQPKHVIVYGLLVDELQKYQTPITHIPAFYSKFSQNK